MAYGYLLLPRRSPCRDFGTRRHKSPARPLRFTSFASLRLLHFAAFPLRRRPCACAAASLRYGASSSSRVLLLRFAASVATSLRAAWGLDRHPQVPGCSVWHGVPPSRVLSHAYGSKEDDKGGIGHGEAMTPSPTNGRQVHRGI